MRWQQSRRSENVEDRRSMGRISRGGAVGIGGLGLLIVVIGTVFFGQDPAQLVSFPAALRQATAAYAGALAPLHYDLLAATPLAGLPIGTALCLALDRPLIYPRKTAKSYGTGKNIEGRWSIGQTVVVIDDLITSGDSVLETIASVKAAGLHVHDAVVLIDREQGGREMLEQQGYGVHPVMTLRQMLEHLVAHGRLSGPQRDEVLMSLGLI